MIRAINPPTIDTLPLNPSGRSTIIGIGTIHDSTHIAGSAAVLSAIDALAVGADICCDVYGLLAG